MHVQTLHLLIDAVTLLNNRGLLERVEKMSQYTELKAQIAKLQEQAEEARRAELEAVLADIRRKIVEYGLTAQDLGLSVVRRGWPPKWIAGKNRERFLISQAHS
ncbi:MAG: DNA-binding protein H-NS [uncultured Caballeronia sp.]|nr:MAG: DNA-binding protein H-NS [uncultured Caballeronia sp.]